MMTITSIPTRAELVRRAHEIAPLLQEHATWNEQHRRLHDQSIQALEQAGLFKLRVPLRYGGYESDSRTLVEVLAELGQGDGSTAWVAWVLASNTWLIGLFPDAVQDEVFTNPDVRVSGTLSPTGRAERRDDGFVLNGSWHFQSGALHSQWSVMAAMSTTPQGTPVPIVALIPTTELELLDDWIPQVSEEPAASAPSLMRSLSPHNVFSRYFPCLPDSLPLWRNMQWEDGA